MTAQKFKTLNSKPEILNNIKCSKSQCSKLSNLSPCPLPLQGKGAKKKRGGFPLSRSRGQPLPLRALPGAGERKRREKVNIGSPGGTKSLFYNYFLLSRSRGQPLPLRALPGAGERKRREKVNIGSPGGTKSLF
jgi:hypothetical protein